MLDALSLNFGGGWRIARELFRPEEPWASPRADAGIDEIHVLSRGNSKILERLIGRPRLVVEIYPMIIAAMRGKNSAVEQQQTDDRRYAGQTSARDSMASAKIELVQIKLEELLQDLMQFEAGSQRRSRRKRR